MHTALALDSPPSSNKGTLLPIVGSVGDVCTRQDVTVSLFIVTVVYIIAGASLDFSRAISHLLAENRPPRFSTVVSRRFVILRSSRFPVKEKKKKKNERK